MSSYIVARFDDDSTVYQKGFIDLNLDHEGKLWVYRYGRLVEQQSTNPPAVVKSLEVSHDILMALEDELRRVSFDVTCPENEMLLANRDLMEQQGSTAAEDHLKKGSNIPPEPQPPKNELINEFTEGGSSNEESS